MRKIFIALLLSFFFCIALIQVSAQQRPPGLPLPNAPKNWAMFGYIQDSAALFIERDTFSSRFPALIKHLDHNFYYTNGNGGNWHSINDTSRWYAAIVALQTGKLNVSDTSLFHGQFAQLFSGVALNTTAIAGKQTSLGYVNVVDSGAVGNGVTDCTIAFQKCLASGKNVFVPNGVFNVTSTLLINSNQVLRGQSRNATIQTSLNIPILSSSNSTSTYLASAEIRDIRFFNAFPVIAGAGQTCWTVILNNPQTCTVDNINIASNFGDNDYNIYNLSGLYMKNYALPATFVNSVTGSLFQGSSIRFEGSDSKIQDCYVWGHPLGVPTIDLRGGNINVFDCNGIIPAREGGGIAINAGNCTIKGNFFDGSYSNIKTGWGVIGSNATGLKILDNTFWNIGRGSIFTTTCNPETISNNSFIENNRFDSSYSDILLVGSATSIVSNNSFIIYGARTRPGNAVKEMSGAANNTYIGNIVNGNYNTPLFNANQPNAIGQWGTYIKNVLQDTLTVPFLNFSGITGNRLMLYDGGTSTNRYGINVDGTGHGLGFFSGNNGSSTMTWSNYGDAGAAGMYMYLNQVGIKQLRDSLTFGSSPSFGNKYLINDGGTISTRIGMGFNNGLMALFTSNGANILFGSGVDSKSISSANATFAMNANKTSTAYSRIFGTSLQLNKDSLPTNNSPINLVGINNVSGLLEKTTIIPPSKNDIQRIFNVLNYGAINDGITDATAGIQAAINACDLAGGGTVYFPNGIYNIAGALQTNVGGLNMNSQLYIPAHAFTDPLRTHITLRGETAPNFTQVGPLIDFPLSTTGVILKSTLVNGATDAAVIGTNGPVQTFGTYNYNYLSVENIMITVKNNPSGTGPVVGGISYKNGAALETNKVIIVIDTLGSACKYPANQVTGIETPDNSSETMTNIENTIVTGFRSGFKTGEHVILNQAQAYCCLYGFELKRGGHMMTSIRACSQWCAYDIYVSGLCITSGFGLAVEWRHNGNWFDNIATVKDTSNSFYGDLHYSIVKSYLGLADTVFSIIGGANLFAHSNFYGTVTNGSSKYVYQQGFGNVNPNLSVGNSGAGKSIGLVSGATGAELVFDKSGGFDISGELSSAFTGNTLGGYSSSYFHLTPKDATFYVPLKTTSIVDSIITPGIGALSVKNTSATGGGLISVKNNGTGSITLQANGSSYASIPSLYHIGAIGISGDLTALNFITNGDVATGGTAPMNFAPGGYSTTPTMTVLAGSPGKVGIGTIAPSTALQVIGTTTTTNLTVTSLPLGLTTDTVVTVLNGVFRKVAPITATNYLTRTGTMLSTTTANDSLTIGGSLRLPNLTTGLSTDSTVVYNNGVLKKIAPITSANQITSIKSTAQTTGGSNAFTTTANDGLKHQYTVYSHVKINSVATDVLQVQVTFTDEDGTVQTMNLGAALTSTGYYALSPISFSASPNTVITFKITLTTSTGTINYNATGALWQTGI